MIVHDVDQRTPEWAALRVGKFTSTDAADLMAPSLKNGGEPAKRKALRDRLICERLTGVSAGSEYRNAAMARGLALEPAAISAVEDAIGALVWPVGFVSHDTLPTGCSPDGVVGEFAGVVEVKCPTSAMHLSYLRAGIVPAEYRPQVIHLLFVTGAPWVEFGSYDDRFPDGLRLFHTRYLRDDEEMQAYELLLRVFLADIEREVALIQGLVPAA